MTHFSVQITGRTLKYIPKSNSAKGGYPSKTAKHKNCGSLFCFEVFSAKRCHSTTYRGQIWDAVVILVVGVFRSVVSSCLVFPTDGTFWLLLFLDTAIREQGEILLSKDKEPTFTTHMLDTHFKNIVVLWIPYVGGFHKPTGTMQYVQDLSSTVCN